MRRRGNLKHTNKRKEWFILLSFYDVVVESEIVVVPNFTIVFMAFM